MACFYIQVLDGVKYSSPILSPAQLRELRNSEENKQNVSKARQGDERAKRALVQTLYNSIPEDGLLKGSHRLGNSFMFDHDDPATREEFIHKCMMHTDELLLLERSVKGAHGVFRRHPGESILEGQYRIAKLLDVEFDNSCKDPTRVCFSTTASDEDLLFVHDDLFDQTPCPEDELMEIEARVKTKQERVPAELLKANKHCKVNPNAEAKAAGDEATQAESEQEMSEAKQRDILMLEELKKREFSDYDKHEAGRNNSLYDFCLTARYLMDFNYDRMKRAILAGFSFDLSDAEVSSTIRSAISHTRGRIPKVAKAILAKYSKDKEISDAAVWEMQHGQFGTVKGGYPTMSSAMLDDACMPALPAALVTTLKVAPVGYKFVQLCMLPPIIGTLATHVREVFDKAPHMLNAWSHLDGPPMSNKNLMVVISNQLTEPIAEEDARNREAYNKAVEMRDIMRNADTVPSIPDMKFRILPENTTRNAHLAIMDAMPGIMTYSLIPEVRAITGKRGFYDRSDFETRRHDNATLGTFTAVSTSKLVDPPICWNVESSSNRKDTLRHWQQYAATGENSRVFFVLNPDNTFSPKPYYAQYTEADKAVIRRLSELLMKFKGLVRTPKLDKAITAWQEQVRQEAAAEQDVARATFSKRATDIAHTSAVCIHLCFIAQKIMNTEDKMLKDINKLRKQMEQLQNKTIPDSEAIGQLTKQIDEAERGLKEYRITSLDLKQYTECKAVVEYGILFADRCLDNQCLLWGNQLRDSLLAAYEGVGTAKPKKSDVDFAKIPDHFTLQNVMEVLPELRKDAAQKRVTRWIKSGLINKVATEQGMAYYAKRFAK